VRGRRTGAGPQDATPLVLRATERGDTTLNSELTINDQTEHDLTDVDTAEPLAARAPVAEQAPLFADLGVRSETVDALSAVGITRAFAIQEFTLPIALAGHDVIGQARTGTGKTLGFGIPILQQITSPDEGADGLPQALVVVPTRELCLQVTKDVATAGAVRRVRTLAVYGGRAYEPQVDALRRGIDIVVGTPGRLLDLTQQGHLRLHKVRILVLDEADEMLDLGFLPDVERILAAVSDDRQTMLFSATMPGPIVALARRFMRQPTHIRAEHPDENRTVPNTRQFVYRAHAMDKVDLLARLLQARGRGLTMVFCRTKRTAQKVADDLADRGFAAAASHGDLGQGAREQAMRAFRSGKVDVLVATDVAARGLDVENVTHVVNYQCPEDEKVYLHRIGRTGRAGASGVAVTFVDWDDVVRWQQINAALDLPFPEPVETYSTSDHLFSDLDIPEGTGATLPRGQRTRAGLAAEELEDIGETGRGRRPRSGPLPAGGGRARGERGERGARGADRGADRGAERGAERPEPRRAPGRRRRTRSGQPVTPAAGEPAVQRSAPDGAGRSEPAPGTDATTGPAAARGGRPRRRRGRSRGGAAGPAPGSGSASGSAAGSAAGPAAASGSGSE